MAKNLHRSGLGKGLTDLFGGEEMVDVSEPEVAGVSKLPMNQIEPNRGQPRKVFDPAAMEELTGAIMEKGTVEGVDAVSGATVTSEGVFAAVKAALEQ